MDKVSKGLCKGVQSGDCILISGKIPKNKDEVPEEHILFLTGIQAPKVTNPTKMQDEEAFAWESRDFVRKMIAGKVVQYTVDFINNDRMVGQIFIDGKNVGIELLKTGLAKCGYVPKANEALTRTPYWEEIHKAEDEAKKKKIGFWGGDIAKHKRKFCQVIDDSFDMKLIESLVKTRRKIKIIIEYVFNCAFFAIYIPEFSAYAKVCLRFIAIPNNKEQILVKTGKAYVERVSLHQDAILTAYGIDDQRNIIGDVKCAKGDLASLVLKEGYSKVFVNNNIPFSTEELGLIKSYQTEARKEKLRVWKNEPDEEKPTYVKSDEYELGEVRCFIVYSGDSIGVINKHGENTRIFLSNVKAPAMAKIGTDDLDQPWAFQAKEFLRRTLVGKKVRADFDYAKFLPKDNRRMIFYTVYYKVDTEKNRDFGKERCANVDILYNGLANIVTFKVDEGQPSRELDKMRAAEAAAKERKVGLYSNRTPPSSAFSDLIFAAKIKKKEFTSFLVGLEKAQCVVEFCYTGARFKIRVDKKQCMIPFTAIGVKCFMKDYNHSEIYNKYYEVALGYVCNECLQRDAVCDIIAADRASNYYGHLIINGKNYATELIRRGLAVVNEEAVNPNVYYREFKKAEEEAESKKLGVWAHEGLGNILKYGEGYKARSEYKEKNEDVTLRVTDYYDFHKFYVNIMPNPTLEKIEQVLETYDKTPSKCVKLELPVKLDTYCAAKYQEDNKYYRATIKSQTKDKKFEVQFIDYGTVEYLGIEDLIKLDSSISTIKPQSIFCEMAYLKYSDNSMKKAVKKFPDFADIDLNLKGKICYTYTTDEEENKTGVIIYKKGNEINSSYHADLLKLGYAKIERKRPLPPYMKELEKVESKAADEKLGLWAENEETDYGQDDYEDDTY